MKLKNGEHIKTLGEKLSLLPKITFNFKSPSSWKVHNQISRAQKTFQATLFVVTFIVFKNKQTNKPQT